MSRFSRLYRGETDFDFVGRSTTWFRVSSVLVLVSVVALVFLQLNLSLDFVGGTSVQVANPDNVTVAEMRDALTPLGLASARIEELEGADGEKSLRVRIDPVDEATELEVVRTVADTVGVALETTSVETVGPTFGEQIAQRALLALVVFLGAAIVFIAWRLEWKMGIAGIAALFHDLTITVGVYALTQFEVTPATVVAILTILGYSLYDTVVVFDKVKENVEIEEDQKTYVEHVNDALNQVMMRSINTSLTSLLPVGSLLFIGSSLLGAGTLRDFALALFVGIAAGTYSSIFVAAPILARWKARDLAAEEAAREAEKAERRARRNQPKREAPTAPTKTSIQGGRFDSRPSSGGAATPRPPKKRRKR